jgi:diguanylate cyclase (GGDEF)-like protein
MKPFRPQIPRLDHWFKGQSRVVRDLIVMAAIMLPLYLAAVWWDGLDKFLAWTNEPESDAVDWLIILFVFLGIGAKIYSVRRTMDLQSEVRRRRKAERDAHRLARQDALTGLPNRRWFVEEFDKWTCACGEGDACAVFVIDLDNFKPVNDVYGHRLGDEVLRIVAKRLSHLAKGAAVARLGGDEFGIIMHYRRNGDTPERLARHIVNEISKPIRLASLALQVGVSVGVSTWIPGVSGNLAMATRDGAPVNTALRQADMAMYWAKAEGRGRYRFFDRTMDEKLQERVELEADIAGAIDAGLIVPYYQPIIDLATSKTVGFEVLARWHHPVRGVLLPELFVSVAEDTGAIGKMTEHLLTQALRDAKAWPDPLFVSINLTPRQVSDPTLATKLLALLAKFSFPPHRLVVEITESALVQRIEDAKAALQSLRHVGVRVALDDFGVGYSGLYHLRELDLDIIKIDRSFVTKMLDKPEEAKIVQAIVSLSHGLGLHTTAEGIETTQILARLKALGCDTGQGTLFGAPAPAAATAQAIREHAGKAAHPSRKIA